MILLMPYTAVSLTKDFMFAIVIKSPLANPPRGEGVGTLWGYAHYLFLIISLISEFEYSIIRVLEFSFFRDLPFAYRLPPLGEGWGGGLYPKNT